MNRLQILSLMVFG